MGGGSVDILRQDGSLSDDDHMSTTELLLQLTDETRLDLVEVLQLLEGNEYNDSLSPGIHFDLLGGADVEVMKVSFELSGTHLEVQQLIGDLVLEIIGSGSPSLDDFLHRSHGSTAGVEDRPR